jgi:putative ABC transport system permease protein
VRWHRNLKLSYRAISRSWLRTTLSVSGVAIGIASVVLLVGAGAGAKRALGEALEQLGHNLLVVRAARSETSALRGAGRISTSLTVEDWKAIERGVRGVLRAAPLAETKLLARVGGRTVPVSVLGTTAAYAEARNFPTIEGRFILDEDLDERRRVVVVGSVVVENLFRGESPLGESLLLGGIPFRIIGVTRKKGISPEGTNQDELVFIPLATAMRRLMNVDSLAMVYVQTISQEAVPGARDEIEDLLRRRHGTPDGEISDFTIQDQTAIVRAQQKAGGSFSRIVTALSALALGLGGTGLLAVSLLSVRERYSEIGLRLAVGGLPRDILLQFFTEAVIISILGGAAGIVLGGSGIIIGTSLTQWPMVLNWQSVVYPFAISVAIAVVFGAYPALRAARLDPILALNSK